MIRLEISDVVAANLLASLQAVGNGSPLDALNTGPWLEELRSAIPKVRTPPILGAEELRRDALDWPASRRTAKKEEC